MTFSRYVQVPLEVVPFDDKRQMLAIWEAARGDRRLPAWGRDLSFTDFPPAYVPRMVLLLPTTDIAGSVVHFIGSSARQAIGEDMTGHRLCELGDADLSTDFAAQYAEVVASAEPRFYVTRFRPFRIDEVYEGILRMPLGNDHAHVDTVLSLAFGEKEGFAARRLWDDHVAVPPSRAAAG